MDPTDLRDPFISILVFSISETSIIQAMGELRRYKLVCKKWKDVITNSNIEKYLTEKFSLEFPFYSYFKIRRSLIMSSKNTAAKAWGEYIVYQDGGILNILGKGLSTECQCFAAEGDYICIVGNSRLSIYKNYLSPNNLIYIKKVPKQGIKYCAGISEFKGITFYIALKEFWRIVTISKKEDILCEKRHIKNDNYQRFLSYIGRIGYHETYAFPESRNDMFVIARHPGGDILKIDDTIIAKTKDKLLWSKKYKISTSGDHYFSGDLLVIRQPRNHSIIINILTGDEISLPFNIFGIAKRKDGGYFILRRGLGDH